MTTISSRSTRTTRRNRTLAAAMLAAAATGAIGYAHAATEEQAVTQALINCNEWQGFCALAVVAKKGNCVALATRSNGQEYVGAKAKDRPKAINAALAGLPGGEIKFSYCM